MTDDDFGAGTVIASSLMDRKGRKSLLITSFSGMVITNIYFTLCLAKVIQIFIPNQWPNFLSHVI